jgi:hypothetical protein
MPRIPFRFGDMVAVCFGAAEFAFEEPAVFQELASKDTAMVFIVPRDDSDDGIRAIAVERVKPIHQIESERIKRRRHAIHAYRNGVRVFRVDQPHGERFYVDMLDATTGKAVGHKFGRKTLRNVALCDLYPNIED